MILASRKPKPNQEIAINRVCMIMYNAGEPGAGCSAHADGCDGSAGSYHITKKTHPPNTTPHTTPQTLKESPPPGEPPRLVF